MRHKAQRESHEAIENLFHASHPCRYIINDKIEKVKNASTVLENRHVGIKVMVDDLNIFYRSTQHIMVNGLGILCVNGRL